MGGIPPNEAETLLSKFDRSGLRFRFACDTSPSDTEINALHMERATIEIFVHREDLESALKIMADWRSLVGGPESQNI